jgi:hypothetical protein
MSLFKSLFNLLKGSNKNNTNNRTNKKEKPTQESNQPDEKVKVSKNEKYAGKDLIKYTEWLSNVTEKNEDGTNRQQIIAECQVEDKVTFKVYQTKDEYYYLEVWTNKGCIGVVHNFDTLQTVAKYVKNGGRIHNAKIDEIRRPKTNRGKISCKISFERNKMR